MKDFKKASLELKKSLIELMHKNAYCWYNVFKEIGINREEAVKRTVKMLKKVGSMPTGLSFTLSYENYSEKALNYYIDKQIRQSTCGDYFEEGEKHDRL